MKNYIIFKMRQAGLTNIQVLNVLRYSENKQKDLSLRDIAVISECRNPALFIERFKQIDDDILQKEFEKFPSFSILSNSPFNSSFERSTYLCLNKLAE